MKFGLLVYLLVITFNVVGVSSGTTCQNGWTGYNSRCYLFVMHMSADWNEASQFCHTQNSRLAEIDNAREDNFLVQHLKDYGRSANFWVGGTDVIIEGDWIWSLSQTPIHHYTHWDPREPNDLGGDENCMEMRQEYGYMWNDMSCHVRQYFICEQPSGLGPVVG
ncbi:perlucin-like [Saccostrea cucullata]|uniref:perlucin-like n=1 Tax=Saccostrea cuccullata TaxID=36930 RepID=UPI002ED265F7